MTSDVARAAVYEFDARPLADRRPLLLVHGLDGENWPFRRYKGIARKFSQHPQFDEHFKLYVLRYNSRVPREESVAEFRNAFLELHSRAGGKPVTVLTLSLAGNIACEATSDPRVDSGLHLIMSMGGLFHGSPLFCKDWYFYGLHKNFYWPWSKVDHAIIYRFYFMRYPNLLKEYCWDHCDGLMPSPGKFRSLLPLGPRGTLIAATDARSCLTPASSKQKKKLITYAGYLRNPYLEHRASLRRLRLLTGAPHRFLTSTLPGHFAYERAVLRVLNREITRLPSGLDRHQSSGSANAYGLNDGVAPVASAVFLPPAACRAAVAATETDIPKLRRWIDVRQARIFAGVDHLSYIDGKREVRDALQPHAPARTMIDWIVSDLVRSLPPTPALAAGEAERQAEQEKSAP